MKSFYEPFKVVIGEPWWLVSNTAPTINEIKNIVMKAGEQHIFDLGLPFDFESN